MHACVDLPARETTHRRFIEAPAASERADQRGADPGKCFSHLRSPRLRASRFGAAGSAAYLSSDHTTYPTPSTSFIVYQPCLPWIHFAAVSAPRANAVRSRAACESVTVSAGPSKPTWCMPGMKPARVDETSIGRGNPDSSIVRLSRIAVPDGASFFAA